MPPQVFPNATWLEGRTSKLAPREHTQVCRTATEVDSQVPPGKNPTHQSRARLCQPHCNDIPMIAGPAPLAAGSRTMASSDPLHGVPVTLSEETRVVWSPPSLRVASSHRPTRGICTCATSTHLLPTTQMENRHDRKTTHQHQPAGSPRLKVLLWNVQGLQPKRHQVLQAVFEEDLDGVLLQETLMSAAFKEWLVGLHSPLSPCHRGHLQLCGGGEEHHPSQQSRCPTSLQR
ncbi:hypothetical protein E2C01_022294 [Portunus trituberculatus]|uniref:Endonuclease/exonuclease/phosphatase domain-containing protein n=1 Tax=Portunus trituberculatus TaxID=210409 RepID=A0A5B7E6W7_PORTR|nr:hypothetical protein [Portunus trituberculatus]